jgi:1-acyl-sn-glycerol-3-phosphate acyltransferase
MNESETFDPGWQSFYDFCHVIVRIVLRLLMRTTVTGLENVPRTGPVLLAPNHLTWFDIPSIAAPIPRQVYMMGKQENFQVPVLGAILRAFGSWPVRRHEIDRQALKKCQACLRAGHPLGIFPEGTRSRTGGLQRGWPGLALIALQNPDVPIVPVAIWGTERVLKQRFIPFFGPRVYIHYGKPFKLEPIAGKRLRDQLPLHTERIMRTIAAQLPPQYRGIYADTVATGQPAPTSITETKQESTRLAEELETQAGELPSPGELS